MKTARNINNLIIDAFCYISLSLLAIATLLPFMNVLAKSLSANWAIISGKVKILPVGLQLDSLEYVVSSKSFINAFFNSVTVTVGGTLLAISLTALTAYPLSKKHLFGIKFVLLLFVFTMLFNGGMIPNYLLIKELGLLNKLWALMLPGMISVFNMLIVKSYYESLPESIEESAKLDGASNLIILLRIVLPLSMPVLATISLFYAVTLWNDYFNPMLYITKSSARTLQLYLRDIVMEAMSETGDISKNATMDQLDTLSPESIRAAAIIASTVPILLIYPFLQKHFIKGVLIGSVKG